MAKSQRHKQLTAIHIDGGSASAHTKRVVGELSKHLGRAIELGRESVAVEIVRSLGETAGVKHTTITGCTFGSLKGSL